MAKWSNSSNGNVRYSVNRQNASGKYFGPTRGLSSPKNSRRACLCLDKDTYDVACCQGALMQQGIGVIQGYVDIRVPTGPFSKGFSSGFKTTI
jgi:hypothetical protein